jgi:hypothetical protein
MKVILNMLAVHSAIVIAIDITVITIHHKMSSSTWEADIWWNGFPRQEKYKVVKIISQPLIYGS